MVWAPFLLFVGTFLAKKAHPCLSEAKFKEKFGDKLKIGEPILSEKFQTSECNTARFYTSEYEKIPLVVKIYNITDEDSTRQAYREALMMDKLKDVESIVKMYGCLRNSTHVSIFMERLGDSLLDGVKDFQKRSWPDRLRMLIPPTEAYIAIKKENRSHRDIKPNNMALSLDGKILKIIDFGFSVHLDTISMAGTLFFYPPEILLGQTNAVRPSHDVWSWCVTIICALFFDMSEPLQLQIRVDPFYIWQPKGKAFVKRFLKRHSQHTGIPFRKIIGPWFKIKSENRPTMEQILSDLKILLQWAENIYNEDGTKKIKRRNHEQKKEIDLDLQKVSVIPLTENAKTELFLKA